MHILAHILLSGHVDHMLILWSDPPIVPPAIMELTQSSCGGFVFAGLWRLWIFYRSHGLLRRLGEGSDLSLFVGLLRGHGTCRVWKDRTTQIRRTRKKLRECELQKWFCLEVLMDLEEDR